MMYLSHISVENKYCTLSNISIEQDENSFVTNDLVVSYLRENMLHPDSIKLDEYSRLYRTKMSHTCFKSI